MQDEITILSTPVQLEQEVHGEKPVDDQFVPTIHEVEDTLLLIDTHVTFEVLPEGETSPFEQGSHTVKSVITLEVAPERAYELAGQVIFPVHVAFVRPADAP